MKDFPLICYRHSGFGVLKKFLTTCQNINTALNGLVTLEITASSLSSLNTIYTDDSKNTKFGLFLFNLKKFNFTFNCFLLI